MVRALVKFFHSSVLFGKQTKPVLTDRERGLLQRTNSLNIHVSQLQRQHRVLMHENEQLVRGDFSFLLLVFLLVTLALYV